MTAQKAELRKLIAKMEPSVRKAFLKAIAQSIASIDQAELIRLLERGHLEAALELLRIDQSYLWPLQEAIRTSFVAGGALSEAVVNRGLSGVYAFSGSNFRAEAWITQRAGAMVHGIVEETQEGLRRVLFQGLEQGRSSRAIALEITGRKVGVIRVGGFLGLNTDQTDQVMTARSLLGDPARIREYFVKDAKTGRWKPRFKLSDRRFDSRIIRAIKTGEAINGRELDRIVEAHKSKALGYRGRVIAKDETRRAIAAGREEGFVQALERPDVEAVTVRWQHNLSKEPWIDHVAMNGTVKQLGETFQFPDGTQMKHPHDETAPAKHRIGCNCMAVYRVKFRRGTRSG